MLISIFWIFVFIARHVFCWPQCCSKFLLISCKSHVLCVHKSDVFSAQSIDRFKVERGTFEHFYRCFYNFFCAIARAPRVMIIFDFARQIFAGRWKQRVGPHTGQITTDLDRALSFEDVFTQRVFYGSKENSLMTTTLTCVKTTKEAKETKTE